MSSPRSARAVARASQTLSARLRRLPASARAALVLSVALGAPPAEGAARERPADVAVDPSGAPPVTLAEVASQVEPSATRLGNLKEVLRREVEAELAAIDWSKESLRRRYRLSAAVVRLDTARAGGGLRISCTVSAAVRDDRGVLLAVVEGRARADGDEGTGAGVATVEQGALAGAVRGAITAVPEAIRRSR
jgi:hypothetical protein